MNEAANDPRNILGEDMIPLNDIAAPVFNITPRIAQRKAALHTLPIPAFRIGNTKRGPAIVQTDFHGSRQTRLQLSGRISDQSHQALG